MSFLKTALLALLITSPAWADSNQDQLDQVPEQQITIETENHRTNLGRTANPSLGNSGVINNRNYYYDNGMALPPQGSIVPIYIAGPGRVLNNPGRPLPLADLMYEVQRNLAAQGYNTNLGYYKVQKVSVRTEAFRSHSGASLALVQSPINGPTYPGALSNVLVNGLGDYTLFNSAGPMGALDWPLNIHYNGTLQVYQIEVFITPKIRVGRTPTYPPVPRGPRTSGNYSQKFCSGRYNVVTQIGETVRFHKDAFNNGDDKYVLYNTGAYDQRLIYKQCRSLIISVTHADVTLKKVELQVIDRNGYKTNFLLDERTINVDEGDEISYPIPNGLSVLSVTLRGDSPNPMGSRARVTVGLN